MDIVVDTSVIIAVITNEPEKGALVELTRGADLIAPLSVHWEVGNAFSAMLRRNRITLNVALEAVEAYQRIPIRLVDVELDESLRLTGGLSIYAYDAYLIRCAQRYRSPLLSLDSYLVESARRTNIDVLEISK
jgi:predicted nucleic acid-binding protein